ncbi:MAG: hypothetical protein LBO67_04405 [Spirochaetaceae bacterium]|nr:hypothetical protein [Spirochaetaceae bacterium]
MMCIRSSRALLQAVMPQAGLCIGFPAQSLYVPLAKQRGPWRRLLKKNSVHG